LVLPGEPLAPGRLNICLTFDDATADFRHQVYPLLQALDGRALVAVPTAYVEESTAASLETRLAAQGTVAMGGDYAVPGSPLCTWAELREMQDSGRVTCAAHGHRHLDMARPEADVTLELALSAAALERHLGRPPDTFVYPFGRSTRAVQRRVAERFPFAMRIGGAVNAGWAPLLYRVDAERFWPDGALWSSADALRWRLKYLANRVRGR
jgi:peptidoglycan/xylan/chitin deacetylase (PgdA/CDA1 family)